MNLARLRRDLRAISGGVASIIAVAPEAVRNSANDSTDTNEVTLATLAVPAGIGARPGSHFEFHSWWENTNSAGTKNFIERINGTSVGSGTNTTNINYVQRQVFHVLGDGSLWTVNSFLGTNGGGSATPFYSCGVANVNASGFSLAYTCKWNAAAAGEFIRLKFAKLVLVPAP